MAATEAIADLLIQAGLIDRTEYNIARFHHAEKLLEQIASQHLKTAEA